MLVASAWTDGDDLALHRLFLGGVRDDDTARSPLLGTETTDHHPIAQRTEFHWIMPNLVPAIKAGLLTPNLAGTLQVQVVWHSVPGSAEHLARREVAFKLQAGLFGRNRLALANQCNRKESRAARG